MGLDELGDAGEQGQGSFVRTTVNLCVAVGTGVLSGVLSVVLMFLQLVPLLNLAPALMIGWVMLIPMLLVVVAWGVFLFRLWDALPLEPLFALDSRSRIKRRKWLILGTVGHVLACVLLWGIAAHLYWSEREEEVQRFEAKIADIRSDWDALFKSYPGVSAPAAPSPLHGVMIVNMDTREWEPLLMSVNETSLATTRNELRHLIRVRRGERQVGTYTKSGDAAVRQMCDLEIVDVPAGRLVFKTSLEGTMPTTYRRRRSQRTTAGSDPLLDWLQTNSLIPR